MRYLILISNIFFSTLLVESQSACTSSSYDIIPLDNKSAVLDDDFNSNYNNWWLHEYGSQSGIINNGFYYLSSKSRTKSVFKDIEIPDNIDFELEITAKLLGYNVNQKRHSAFGIIWGKHYYDKKQYSFSINLAQQVNVSKRSSASVFKYYLKNKRIPHLNVLDFNKLTVRRVSNCYFLFINEEFVTSFKTESLYGNGIGFAVSNGSLIIDSFTIKELNSKNEFKLLSYGKNELEIDFTQTENVPNTKKDEIEPEAEINLIAKQIFAVDNVLKTGNEDNNAFALIVGNENYLQEQSVQFALNDALIFKLYATNVLGVPPSHIHFVKDGTFGQILSEIDWLKNIIKSYKGDASIYLYYAGHGFPDEATKSSYLLPVDGYSSNVVTGIKLDDVYQALSMYSTRNVTVFIDACFSGGSRAGMLADGRGVSIVPKKNIVSGNLIVFTATSGNETAHPYIEKSHGLFTYFLLKKMKESGKDLTYGELFDYLTLNVSKISAVHNKMQTPNIIISPSIQGDWKNKKFKNIE